MSGRFVSATLVRGLGLVLSLAYAGFIIWLYTMQPRTMAEVAGGVAAGVGVYRIDQASFDEGLRFFRADKFVEARNAFERADPAKQHAPTQFYVAYSYLRQGWGRVYSDDALMKQALAAVERAVAVAPGGVVRVDDARVTLKTSDELRAEIERNLTREVSDFNPLKVFRERP